MGEVEGQGSVQEGGGSDLGLCLDLGFLGFLKMDCMFSEDGLLGLCLYSYRCLGLCLLFLCLVDKKNQLLDLCLLLLCLVWLIYCWVCVCVSGFVIFGF